MDLVYVSFSLKSFSCADNESFESYYTDFLKPLIKFLNKIIMNKQSHPIYIKMIPLLLKKYKKQTNKHLGNIYLLRYNPVFRSVDCRCSIEPFGLFVKINYRRNQKVELRLRVSDFHQSGMAVYEKEVKLDYVPNGYTFIELPEEPHRLTIKLFDKTGDLVYYQDNIVFIRSFNLDVKMQTKTIRLNIKDRKGKEKNKDIHKFASMERRMEKKSFVPEEFFAQPDRKVIDGDFHFFDGNKERKAENVNAAKKIVSEILDKAKKECYICDPYFSAEDFVEFVFPVKDINVPIRILSSKEFLGKQYDEDGNVKSGDAKKEGKEITADLASKTFIIVKTNKCSKILNP